MPDALLAALPAIASALTATAAATSIGMGIYQMTKGTSDVPSVSMPEIPATPATVQTPTPETPAAQAPAASITGRRFAPGGLRSVLSGKGGCHLEPAQRG